MNKGNSILDQFDNIGSIEPTEGWDERFWQRFNTERQAGNAPRNRPIVTAALIILLLFNLFTLTRSLIGSNNVSQEDKLKTVATELLISTSSSQY